MSASITGSSAIRRITIAHGQLNPRHDQTIRAVGATVGHAEHSGDLRRFIEGDKKIVITTVQKFPFILDDIGSQHRNRYFAIIIDEAHSSQGGKASSAVSMALSAAGAEE
jgi:type I restriction enzyme R subunit